MAKNEPPKVPPVPREAIAEIRTEADFVEFLRRRLDWPIPINVERLADVSIPHDLQTDFGFDVEEDRISVSRLLHLSEDQPWGVFLCEFATTRPYLSHLRRLLRVLGSRRTLRKGDPIWDRNDLLFICTHDWREYQFVHFAGERPESAVISTFGWKGPEDPFLYTLCRHNLARLRMPHPRSEGGYDPDRWRDAWRDAFSVKPVTDEFYSTLKEVFEAIQAGVKGLKGEDRRFFAELVVNRMVFLKFVERKGWLDGDRDYLYNRFKQHGRQNYWKNFLCDFFFEALCQEKSRRSKKLNHILGDVPFLNAELFAPSDKWNDWEVQVDNRAFELLFEKLLNPYNFTVRETSPLDVEVAFNQDLLGYGYEELIADQHGQGAYYTLPTEVNLMCRESLRAYLETRCPDAPKDLIGRLVWGELTTGDPLSERDALPLYRALHDVTVVDPALGSGTFPVAMMKHLFAALRVLGSRLKDSVEFRRMLREDGLTDPDDAFSLKLHIIERSIYGCDIDYFAVQIAKLRFWIELMVHCDRPEALPNFDCKLVVGDALVSLVGSDIKGTPYTLEGLLGHPTKRDGQADWLHDLGLEMVDELAVLKKEYFTVRDTRERRTLERKLVKVREHLLREVGVRTDKLTPDAGHVLWQTDFADIFSGKAPGFDIAIANPPYLRCEDIDPALKALVNATYNRLFPNLDVVLKADLYVYFYLRAAMLTGRQGIVCFVCSNSWLDIGYGRSLQLFLLTQTDVLAIYESAVQRSFECADINTIISLFRNTDQTHALENPARLVRLKTDFADLSGPDLREILAADDTTETARWKVVVRAQSEMYRDGQRTAQGGGLLGHYDGDKWGGRYLRAPTFFQRVLATQSKHLCRLALISDIQGYIHDNNTGSRYPKVPFLKSVKDVKCITVLKSSDGVIEYGVKAEGNSRVRAPILFPRTFGTRHVIVWNPDGIYGKEFYKVIPPRERAISIIAQLTSTFGMLQRELIGAANLGDGALKFSGDDVGMFWVLRDLPARDVQKAFEAMAGRPARDFRDELAQPDRRALDDIIFTALGLNQQDRTSIYRATEELIGERLYRAASVKR